MRYILSNYSEYEEQKFDEVKLSTKVTELYVSKPCF